MSALQAAAHAAAHAFSTGCFHSCSGSAEQRRAKRKHDYLQMFAGLRCGQIAFKATPPWAHTSHRMQLLYSALQRLVQTAQVALDPACKAAGEMKTLLSNLGICKTVAASLDICISMGFFSMQFSKPCMFARHHFQNNPFHTEPFHLLNMAILLLSVKTCCGY